MQIEIRQVSYREHEETLMKIREQVFILEQGVPRDVEIDGQDFNASHFLATRNTDVIGSARLLPSGQIGRMAVLPEFRSQGIGFRLLEFVIAYAFSSGFAHLFLHAQSHAISFYEKAGFGAAGEEFMEAGIAHVEMHKSKESVENP